MSRYSSIEVERRVGHAELLALVDVGVPRCRCSTVPRVFADSTRQAGVVVPEPGDRPAAGHGCPSTDEFQPVLGQRQLPPGQVRLERHQVERLRSHLPPRTAVDA